MGKHWAGPRIPLEFDGLQVNFCKNPLCNNFGVPPSVERQPRGKGAAKRPGRDTYRCGSKKGKPIITCTLCGKSWVLKSNLGVAEEVARMQDALKANPKPDRCPNPDCSNKSPVDDELACLNYQLFGTTLKGSVRLRCKKCKKTFSIAPAGVT